MCVDACRALDVELDVSLHKAIGKMTYAPNFVVFVCTCEQLCHFQQLEMLVERTSWCRLKSMMALLMENVIHISGSHGCRSFRCVIAAWQGVRHMLYIPVVVKLSCHLETYDVTYLNSICFPSDICTSMRHFSMGNKVAIYPRRPVTNASLG